MSEVSEATFNSLLNLFIIDIGDFCKKSTVQVLPTITPMPNVSASGTTSAPFPSLSSMISDNEVIECIKKGLNRLKPFLEGMQGTDGGILSAGASVESWNLDNISILMTSKNRKLYGIPNFIVESVKCELAKGNINIFIKWPEVKLTQNYVLDGTIGQEQIRGTGDFEIIIYNYTLSNTIEFEEVGDQIKLKNLNSTCNFDNAAVNVTGIDTPTQINAQELMNAAVKNNKDKLRGMLQDTLSELVDHIQLVLESVLEGTDKQSHVKWFKLWCKDRAPRLEGT